MSLNLQQVINDARKLTSRLKADELKSDALITQAKITQNQIQHIKQYSEDVEILNEAASQRSQSVLVAGLQRESQHLRELQAENRELRAALDDYQNALELIMSKYRQQVSKLTNANHKDMSCYYKSAYTQIILEQCKQIKEMKEVMSRAASMDEEEAIKDREIITQLIAENKGLREMFDVYKKYGRQEAFLGTEQSTPAAAEPKMEAASPAKDLNESNSSQTCEPAVELKIEPVESEVTHSVEVEVTHSVEPSAEDEPVTSHQEEDMDDSSSDDSQNIA